jgi:hypothetical protein
MAGAGGLAVARRLLRAARRIPVPAVARKMAWNVTAVARLQRALPDRDDAALTADAAACAEALESLLALPPAQLAAVWRKGERWTATPGTPGRAASQ